MTILRLLVLLLATAPAFAGTRVEPLAAPLEGAAAAGRGWSVSDEDGRLLDLWIVDEPTRAEVPSEALGVELGAVAKGAVLGRLRLHRAWTDFKGQSIPAGEYVLRYAIRPEDGAHMGVSDFRDFAVLVPADRDPGAKDTLEADELVDVGRAASGTTHPATMAIVPVWEESARDLVSIDDGLGALVGTVAGRRAAFVVAGTASVEGY